MQVDTFSAQLRPCRALAEPTLTLQLLGLMEITDFNVKIRARGKWESHSERIGDFVGAYVSIFAWHSDLNDLYEVCV